MAMSVYFDAQISDDERRERLYAGDIFIFSETVNSRCLISLAQTMLESAFAPHDHVISTNT